MIHFCVFYDHYISTMPQTWNIILARTAQITSPKPRFVIERSYGSQDGIVVYHGGGLRRYGFY
jgi:hypothetical protein